MLPCVCSVIDNRRRQNVIRTSVTHSAIASCATFLFLPHFDVICDLLLNRRTATWNLFVKHRKRQVKYTMRNVFVMFVTAVCFLVFLKLKWPKNKNVYDVSVLVCYKVSSIIETFQISGTNSRVLFFTRDA